MKILVIDDEETIRVIFKAFLEKEGYTVLIAEDYAAAVEILSSANPDMMFADIILPGGQTGIDILREVKKRNLNCPVIMITAQPDMETAADSVRLGAFDYLPKPFIIAGPVPLLLL